MLMKMALRNFNELINAAVSMGSKLIFASAHASDEIPREITYQRLRKAGDNAANMALQYAWKPIQYYAITAMRL